MTILCTLFGLWCAQPVEFHAKAYVRDPASCIYGVEKPSSTNGNAMWVCKDKP